MKRLLLAALLAASPALADEDDALVSFQSLKPEYALKMAEAAMTTCRDQGYQVGVAVVDRFGNLQVFMRDRFAGAVRLLQHHTQVVVCRGVGRIELERPPIAGRRLDEADAVLQGVRQVEMRFRHVRLDRGGALQAIDREIGAPRLQGCDSMVHEDAYLVGSPPQQLLIKFQCRPVSPGPVVVERTL